ncbi:Integral membrane protein [Bacillus cereus R309803]|nr:Integral membrane protein [Bacillus cereus R309803]
MKKASFIMGIVLLVNEVFILTLGVVDYYQTGKFSNFQIITVIILLYAVFYGKKDLKKLDIFAQKLVAKWRNEPAPIMEEHVELTGMAYAKQEIKNWVLHLVLFVGVHIFFFFAYGFIPFEQWGNWLESGIVLNKAASRVSQVWAIILLVDTVISFSYVLFPKKEKGKEKLLS